MKSMNAKITMLKCLALGAMLLTGRALDASAQSYSVNWYKISGGGGASGGGQFSVTGTIGQHDAGGTIAGGNYSITGGFWSVIASVQAPGSPTLTIAQVLPGTIVVSWPDTETCTLQQASSLANGNWTASGYSVSISNGVNNVTINAPTGSLFFRLKSQ